MKKRKKILVIAAGLLLAVFVLAPIMVAATYELAYRGRVYPGVKIDKSKIKSQKSRIVKLTADENEWIVKAEDLGVKLDFWATKRKLFLIGRSGNIIVDTKDKIRAYRQGIEVEPVLDYNRTKVEELIASTSAVINKKVIEPKFRLSRGRVIEFQQGESGRAINEEKLANMIVSSIYSEVDENEVPVPVVTLFPELSAGQMTAEELGIKELIGKGISTFKGSISAREYNVLLTAKKLNGVLIPPGKIFSFNDTIGEVSTGTGYRDAYVIREGRTVLDDGGGVCQDSTTVFRAILDAGLPIVERRAHSYRVGYYEQNSPVGFDATVYAPTADLKFKNDTPGHILLQATGNGATDTLGVEFWGTSDGRISTTSKPVIWDQSPPPEDLYQDDPTLPAGQIKQIDWKAWGAKVKFDYHVERDGEVLIHETIFSNYRPWQAVFLRGTGGV